MTTLTERKYGSPPYQVVLVHGGPGAAGEMAPVAERLHGEGYSVLEPFQTAHTFDGQVEELGTYLRDNLTEPVSLVGYSWGAFLVLLVAAQYADRVAKVILVGCPPLEHRDAEGIPRTRLERMSESERKRYEALEQRFATADEVEKAQLFGEMGKLFHTVDAVDPLEETAETQLSHEIYEKVWPQGAALRASGELLKRIAACQSPIVLLHGESDPHPLEGAVRPLSQLFQDVRYTTFKECGHTPWLERRAKAPFYEALIGALP